MVDGQTYESNAIHTWLSLKQTSPMTRARITPSVTRRLPAQQISTAILMILNRVVQDLVPLDALQKIVPALLQSLPPMYAVQQAPLAELNGLYERDHFSSTGGFLLEPDVLVSYGVLPGNAFVYKHCAFTLSLCAMGDNQAQRWCIRDVSGVQIILLV